MNFIRCKYYGFLPAGTGAVARSAAAFKNWRASPTTASGGQRAATAAARARSGRATSVEVKLCRRKELPPSLRP